MDRSALPDIEAALRLFDETTRALEARSQRLEEVLTVKQQELLHSNAALRDKVEQLARLRAYTDLVVDSVPAGIIAIDLDARITTCNPPAAALLADRCSDVLGADYRALFPDSPMLQVLTDGRTIERYQTRWQRADGRCAILDAQAAPLRQGEQIIGAVETFADVTQLRHLQEQLERAQRLKALGEMAAGVAHEIRNPLNGIEGFASLLRRDLPDDGRAMHYVDAIIDGVRHLNHTVTGLLDYTRPQQPQCRAVPVVELVRSCVELVEAQAREDDGPPPVIAIADAWGSQRFSLDPTQIRQVLLNLIQNALHMHPDPAQARVQVGLERGPDGSLSLIVDDNGPGVATEDRERIFTPFYTTRAEGTGLGLAVAHTMVQLHGGELRLDDSPLGGARFVVWLPLAGGGG